MAKEIKMPQLSDTMSSGKILAWKKKEGDAVKRGDIVAEVETDKANLEIETFHEGVLLKIAVPAGIVCKVGDVIGIVGQPGESVVGVAQTVSQSKPVAPATVPVPAAQPKQPSMSSLSVQPVLSHSDRIKASPLAKKIAADKSIDLSKIAGSGPAGRIVAKDLESGMSSPAPAVQTVHVPVASSQAPSRAGQLAPFSKMRETIARRMQESVTTAPHFYTSVSIDMGETVKLRETLKAQPGFEGLSVNHFVIKAVAYALSKERRVNRAVKDGQIYDPANINIGIITAIEDGLLIPVIKDADQLTLKDIVFEAKAAVERARAGRPNSSDLLGGTFSVSNLGMYGLDNFTAIINPGQGGILAVSAILDKPVVRAGNIIVGKLMNVTLSVDHRIIDGVMAANFLQNLKAALEMPGLMLVG